MRGPGAYCGYLSVLGRTSGSEVCSGLAGSMYSTLHKQTCCWSVKLQYGKCLALTHACQNQAPEKSLGRVEGLVGLTEAN